ncbi:MAG: ribonuclease HII [Alphaproteobacteria bacterium]|nr:ribonuclease HII [Alphaproteobacteria bacterium]
MPDFSMEHTLILRHGGPVAGVDEVGRGPWAGPVVTAAVVLHPDCPPDLLAMIQDSKALKPARREALAGLLLRHAAVGLGAASVPEIDRINILAATMLAMQRAVAALPDAPTAVLIDGNRAPTLPCPSETVVKGDARCLSIAAASIVAKVARDRLMARLAERYPAYGWERNAGYGTKAHREGLQQAGVTPHHRRSFAPIRAMLSQLGH